VESEGYVRVVADQKLIGCLTHATAETYVTLPGEAASAPGRLLAPHFYIPAQGGGQSCDSSTSDLTGDRKDPRLP